MYQRTNSLLDDFHLSGRDGGAGGSLHPEGGNSFFGFHSFAAETASNQIENALEP
jgi:hypothetical protein